ncbi:MAG: hypothetical protein COB14_07230 [Alphaproteobacteria bacterium]|nr:MAG: hypothetical protein COB14_07230 [Alphaproteobacteria bacterium]
MEQKKYLFNEVSLSNGENENGAFLPHAIFKNDDNDVKKFTGKQLENLEKNPREALDEVGISIDQISIAREELDKLAKYSTIEP